MKRIAKSIIISMAVIGMVFFGLVRDSVSASGSANDKIDQTHDKVNQSIDNFFDNIENGEFFKKLEESAFISGLDGVWGKIEEPLSANRVLAIGFIVLCAAVFLVINSVSKKYATHLRDSYEFKMFGLIGVIPVILITIFAVLNAFENSANRLNPFEMALAGIVIAFPSSLILAISVLMKTKKIKHFLLVPLTIGSLVFMIGFVAQMFIAAAVVLVVYAAIGWFTLRAVVSLPGAVTDQILDRGGKCPKCGREGAVGSKCDCGR